MGKKLQIKRGNEADMPILAAGEPGFALDTKKMYMGTGAKNVPVGMTDIATNVKDGIMSAADKAKLDGIDINANKYVHPTGAGDKHIPTGGSSGQVLKYSASGTANWAVNDADTVDGKHAADLQNYNNLSNKPAIASNLLDGNGTNSLRMKSVKTDYTMGSDAFAEGNGTVASGFCAHAEGGDSIASRSYSHAEGKSTIASGEVSHAEGSYTLAAKAADVFYLTLIAVTSNTVTIFTEASPNVSSLVVGMQIYLLGKNNSSPAIYSHVIKSINVSTAVVTVEGTIQSGFTPDTLIVKKDNFMSSDSNHAEGYCAHATGEYSHAEGNATRASGKNSHAEGGYNDASGENSHAECAANVASGFASHAEGANSQAINWVTHAEGDHTLASGIDSHSEGNGTIASGNSSHAEGEETTASEKFSHAEGNGTTASGESSHAEGNGTTASGDRSHAEGNGTTASGLYSHAEGSNSQAINSVAHAEGEYTLASGIYSHVEGYRTIASGEGSHAEGSLSEAIGDYSHAEGENTKASGLYSHAEGYYSEASGENSHAEGGGTASGEGSHAEGGATASGWRSHAEGAGIASGLCSHAEGGATKATDEYAHAEGFFTEATGVESHAEGDHTLASGFVSHVEGCDTTALAFQHVQGHYNKGTDAGGGNSTTTGSAFIIGNGTSSTAKSNCFRVQYDGKTFAKGAYSTTGADYAELFEWADGNPGNEDRRGLFVALQGTKIQLANSPADSIIGIISSNPAVIGNNHSETWKDMYIIDIWGDVVTEKKTISAEYRTIKTSERIEDENGVMQKIEKEVQKLIHEEHEAFVPVLNPNYNSDEEYIPRHQRQEWGIVGMFGQLILQDDGSCIADGYCQCTIGGIGTMSETGYYVMERLNEQYVKVLFK